MSWLSNLTGIDVNLGQMWDDVSGKTAANAATSAANIQSDAAKAAAAEQLTAGQTAADQQLAAGELAANRQLTAGQTAADLQMQAARDASGLQARSEASQLAALSAGEAQNRQDLQGAVDFGSGMQPGYQNAMAQQASLFGAGAGDQIMNNPMFQAIQAKNQQDILANQSLGGRLNTGETPQFMQESALRTGFDVLNQERQAALQNSQSFLNPIQMGFNAAANQGQASMQTGANLANTMQGSVANQNQINTNAAMNAGQFGTNAALSAGQFGTNAAGSAGGFNVGAQNIAGGYNTDAASALAAGKIGAANAQAAGTGNLINLGVGAMTGGLSFGMPSFSDVGGSLSNIGTAIGTAINPTQDLSQPGRFGR